MDSLFQCQSLSCFSLDRSPRFAVSQFASCGAANLRRRLIPCRSLARNRFRPQPFLRNPLLPDGSRPDSSLRSMHRFNASHRSSHRSSRRSRHRRFSSLPQPFSPGNSLSGTASPQRQKTRQQTLPPRARRMSRSTLPPFRWAGCRLGWGRSRSDLARR